MFSSKSQSLVKRRQAVLKTYKLDLLEMDNFLEVERTLPSLEDKESFPFTFSVSLILCHSLSKPL